MIQFLLQKQEEPGQRNARAFQQIAEVIIQTLHHFIYICISVGPQHQRIRDIREAHKKDSESAPQTTVADELKENLEAVENFKGSRDEKLVVLYCKQLGINYKNLSDEEFRWLIRILQKSKKTGTPISQRKKR